MTNGWIKTYRKLQEWEWYTDSHMVHLFIHLLLEANHRDRRWRGITIKRGQVLTSRGKLSFETGISERTIRTCLKRLKATNEVTIQSTNRFTLITICNYGSYQVEENGGDQQSDQPSDQRPTSDRPATDQPSHKNVKNYKKNIEPKGSLSETIPTPKEEPINYKNIINFFNQQTKGVFGQVRYPISDNRRQSIRARVVKFGKDAFREMIIKASESDFMKGDNNRGWIATFDWMIRPTNFQKIIEGNYDNKVGNGKVDVSKLGREIISTKKFEEW